MDILLFEGITTLEIQLVLYLGHKFCNLNMSPRDCHLVTLIFLLFRVNCHGVGTIDYEFYDQTGILILEVL